MTQNNSFRERVRALVAEGKLTPEEAEQLLGEANDAAEITTAVELVKRVEPNQVPARFSVKLLSADLHIRGSSDVTEPRLNVHGNARVEMIPTADGWQLIERREEQDGANLLDRIMGGLRRMEPVKIDVDLPLNITHVDLHILAGDVDVTGLSAVVRGKLQAGDLDLSGVRGFDLELKAGDVDISAMLDGGHHRLRAVAGDVDLRLLPGSSARVNASLTAGDFHARGIPFNREGGVVGGRYECTVGGGTAQVDLRLTAGDVEVISQ